MDHGSPKRQRTGGAGLHALQNVQTMPASTEPASQDPFFAQLQLDQSIGSVLTLAGFDGVEATALHSLKALVEECTISPA